MRIPLKFILILIFFVVAIVAIGVSVPKHSSRVVSNTNGIQNTNLSPSPTSTPRRRQIDVVKGVKGVPGKLSYKDPLFQFSFDYPGSWNDFERQFVDFTTGTTKIVETPGGPVEESGKVLILIQKDPKTGFIFEFISPDYPFGSEGFPIPYRGEYDISKICSGQVPLENLQECLVVDGESILITREFDYAGGSWIRAYRNVDWMGYSGLSLMILTSEKDEDEKNLINEILDTLVLE